MKNMLLSNLETHHDPKGFCEVHEFAFGKAWVTKLIGEFVYRPLKGLQLHGLMDTMRGYAECPFFRVDLCVNG